MVTTRNQSRTSSNKVAEKDSNKKKQCKKATVPPLSSPTPAEETRPYEQGSSSPTTNLESQPNQLDSEAGEPDVDENSDEADEDVGEDENSPRSESQPPAPSHRSRGRGRAWQPWEDRILAKEVLAKSAFDPPYGQTTKIWEHIAQIVTNANQTSTPTMKRTAKSCRERWQHLVKSHREEQTRAMQATGTDEEVDEHVQTMTDAVQLIDDLQLRTDKASESAKLKLEKERQAGIEMRQAAMQNMVRREELTDIADLETATVRERQGQRKRAAPADESNKENVDTGGPPKKKRATFQSTMASALKEHQAKEDQALESARKRADEHHDELQASLARLEHSMTRLGGALEQSVELQQRSQDIMLGLIAGSSKANSAN